MRKHLQDIALKGFEMMRVDEATLSQIDAALHPLVSGHVVTVHVSHTPWVPARVESYARLCAQLEAQGARHTVWKERAPNHVWSENMWKDAVSREGATHCLFLQDDVKLAPNFWRALHALIDAHPSQVICLESVHQMIMPLVEESIAGVTTPDGLIGPGYVMPREMLAEFLAWRNSALAPGVLAFLKANEKPPFGEDTLLGLWCAATDRTVLMPVPSLIDHDTSLESTYGNESHGRRRPLVRFDNLGLVYPDGTPGGLEVLETKEYWAQPTIHVGLFYPTTPRMLRTYVSGLTPERFAALKKDDGHAIARKYMYKRRAASQMPATRILIATPMRGGGVHPAHMSSILWVARDEEIIFDEGAFELYDSRMETYDVVRVRSRIVRHFLEESEATHLFFVDSDVSFLPKVLRGMIAAGKDFVAAPYPQREGVDFKSAANYMRHGAPPEASYGYKVFLPPDQTSFSIDDTQCAEIGRVGLGCCLLSRKMLTAMCEAYTPSLVFDDEVTGAPTVALFQLMFAMRPDGKRALLSEDISFCERVRDCGFKIHAYFGDGSPVDHYGEMCYRGALEAFGCKREG